MSALEIEEKALRLSEDERRLLIDRLQSSLHDPTPPDWHGDVLAERLAKIERGEATFISLDEFNTQLDERIHDFKSRTQRS